jgi:hypothetical protein
MSRTITNWGRGIPPGQPEVDVPPAGGLRRTRIKRQSKRRRDENVERAKVREQVFARDGYRCQFFDYVKAAVQGGGLVTDDIAALSFVEECFGPLTPHEPAHSRNVGRLNPEDPVELHEWAESNPVLARKIGWAVEGNGLPSRKWGAAS